MINLTNYNEHPSRKYYTIFHFYKTERAHYFEELLKENDIWFERETEEEPDKITYFFGVKNTDLKQVEKLNYLVSAKYRSPIIANKAIKWSLYAFTAILLVLALLGYLNTKT